MSLFKQLSHEDLIFRLDSRQQFFTDACNSLAQASDFADNEVDVIKKDIHIKHALKLLNLFSDGIYQHPINPHTLDRQELNYHCLACGNPIKLIDKSTPKICDSCNPTTGQYPVKI